MIDPLDYLSTSTLALAICDVLERMRFDAEDKPHTDDLCALTTLWGALANLDGKWDQYLHPQDSRQVRSLLGV